MYKKHSYKLVNLIKLQLHMNFEYFRLNVY